MMKLRYAVIMAALSFVALQMILFSGLPLSIRPQQPISYQQFVQKVEADIKADIQQAKYDDAEEIAQRLYLVHGCDDEFAEATARNAVDQGVPVRVVTAVVIVESSCRPEVRSVEGAVGLMQILPRVWKDSIVSLKDPNYNIHRGTQILAGYIRGHGLREGLHRYNGLGVGCPTCDGKYPNKVLMVAGMINVSPVES